MALPKIIESLYLLTPVTISIKFSTTNFYGDAWTKKSTAWLSAPELFLQVWLLKTNKRKHFLSKLSVFDIKGQWEIIQPELWCLCTRLLVEQIKWFNDLMLFSSIFPKWNISLFTPLCALSLPLHPKTLKGFCLWNLHLPLPFQVQQLEFLRWDSGVWCDHCCRDSLGHFFPC